MVLRPVSTETHRNTSTFWELQATARSRQCRTESIIFRLPVTTDWWVHDKSSIIFYVGADSLPKPVLTSWKVTDWRDTGTRGYKYIVVHHTATRQMTAEEMKLSMTRTRINNRGNNHIPAHFIIWSDGSVATGEDITKPVGAVVMDKYNTLAQVRDANFNGIHIELAGDFNNHKPTDAQYKALSKLVQRLDKQYTGLQIKGHKDFQSKDCPWKLFDFGRIDRTPKKTITFSLSRYYSPVSWQARYYNGRTYEEDKTMNCGAGAIGNDGCLYPADGKILTNADKNKVVACPKEYKLWTKIYLEGIWVVTCRDRGGAIKGNRLDMYCWIWEWALDNRKSCHTWPRQWYVIQ